MARIFFIISLITIAACNSSTNFQSGHTANQQIKKQYDSSTKFSTYCNTRFDYCIDYPIEILSPQPESENGDGRVFTNSHGEKNLIVWGTRNEDPEGNTISLKEQFNNDLKSISEGKSNDTVTYKKLFKTCFVISGYKNGKIFYQKTILKDNAFAYAILEYSKYEKVLFDKISIKLFKSFN